MFACSSPIWPRGVVARRGDAVAAGRVGLAVARPTFAPANWSFSSALITNSVFLGVMPSAARRSKNFWNAAS